MPNIPVSIRATALLLALSITGIAYALPTIHDISDVARAGDLKHAEQMIDEVIAAHPNSAKAHYVAAELAAKAGSSARAREELAKAERFAPGLPFANASAVAELNAALRKPDPSRTFTSFANHSGAGFGIGTWLVGGALLFLFVNFLSLATLAGTQQ